MKVIRILLLNGRSDLKKNNSAGISILVFRVFCVFCAFDNDFNHYWALDLVISGDRNGNGDGDVNTSSNEYTQYEIRSFGEVGGM